MTTVYGAGESRGARLPGRPGTTTATACCWMPARNSWGPNYVRFGLSLQDDFQGNSTYNAAARFVLSEITQPGGEWVWDLQVGETSLICNRGVPADCPIRRASSSCRMPAPRRPMSMCCRIRRAWPNTACAASTTGWISAASSATGARSGPASSARPGTRMSGSAIRLLPSDRFNTQEYFVRLSLRQLDNVNFPHKGQQATLEWRAERTGQLSSAARTRFRAAVIQLSGRAFIRALHRRLFGCRAARPSIPAGACC